MNFINIKKLSKLLDIKEKTLYSWAGCGSIPSYKIKGLLRFDLDEIKDWINKHKLTRDPHHKPIFPIAKNQDLKNIVQKAIANVKGKGV